MINWILQKNLTNPKVLERIKAALIKDNETWEEIEIVPFSNTLPELRDKNAFNIVYGSTTFILNAFAHIDYKKGVFYDPNTFQMKNYVQQWGENILNADGVLLELGQLDKIGSKPDQKWFVRPNHDSKEFSGRVDHFDNLVAWSKKIVGLDLPDLNNNTEIWLSKPKVITKEWRLFIVDDEIISTSRYMKNGELDENSIDIPEKMLQFGEKRIKKYRLDDVYVMDIAEVENDYKLIECNCFNGTGFYKHNIEKVIKAVNHLVRKKLIKQNAQ